MSKKSLFQDLKAGLEEAVQHQQGKIDLKSTSIELPADPPKMSSKLIKEIREKRLHLSQPVFASFLGVTASAVKAWEQGLKKPSGSARRLMQIYGEQPELLQKIASGSKNRRAR